MKVIVAGEMSHEDALYWLRAAKEGIEKDPTSFRNVQALKAEAIDTAIQELSAPLKDPQSVSFGVLQDAVWQWCKETFEGVAAWGTDKERAYRFFEEAGELFQAMGMTRDDAIKVVDYVFGRPVGEKSQEIGGVVITLLALASQQSLSVAEAASKEYFRIIRPEIQNKIRDKQRAKNQAFL